jgi:hypothetical protein
MEVLGWEEVRLAGKYETEGPSPLGNVPVALEVVDDGDFDIVTPISKDRGP